jgi:hypothetical protein
MRRKNDFDSQSIIDMYKTGLNIRPNTPTGQESRYSLPWPTDSQWENRAVGGYPIVGNSNSNLFHEPYLNI